MARGPIPDKPRDRPTVPEAAEKLREYRKLPNRYTGGVVHICVDDPNYAQSHADYCVTSAPTYATEEAASYLSGPAHLRSFAVEPTPELVAADIEIAGLIAALTVTQRRKLSTINTYPDLS
jgi:hypothetical protein